MKEMLMSHPKDDNDSKMYFRCADGSATTDWTKAEKVDRAEAMKLADSARVPAHLVGWFNTPAKKPRVMILPGYSESEMAAKFDVDAE